MDQQLWIRELARRGAQERLEELEHEKHRLLKFLGQLEPSGARATANETPAKRPLSPAQRKAMLRNIRLARLAKARKAQQGGV